MVLGSCYSDKGNYDYEDVNEITVDLGGAKYTYVVGNVAKLEPTLTFATREIAESELEYNWTFHLACYFLYGKLQYPFVRDKLTIHWNLR